MRIPKFPSAALAVGLTPALLALPTVTPPTAAPRPVPPQIASFAIAGVDAPALAELADAGGTASAAGADPQKAATASPRPGAPARTAPAANRPAVLTAPRAAEPFDLVGVTWAGAGSTAGQGVTVSVRVREDGRWTDWEALPISDEGPDAGSPEARATGGRVGTDPLLTDDADGVQVRVDTADGRAPEELRVSLIDPGESPADEALDPRAPASSAAAAAAQPRIITRAQWGADESLRGSAGTNATVRAVFVHHTASTNNYSSATAASQMRAIYAYHTRTRGYSDIAYHFLVDRYGNIYEGRAGSITTAVRGAHAGGFNTDTMGVSALGNFDEVSAPSAMVDALGRVTGWKLSQYGRDVNGRVTLTSAGGGTSRYPEGTRVTVNVVAAHRDVGYTACPGQYLFAKMSTLRAVAADVAGPPPATPPPPPAPPAPEPAPAPQPSAPEFGGAEATPVTGDVDGDRRTDVGWFRDGVWSLRTASGERLKFSFGTRGDIPVLGDWGRVGRDGIAVFRSGRWYLRQTASGGAAQTVLSYGTAGDRPVAGRWPGAGRDGIGIVRGKAWHLRDSPKSAPATRVLSYGRATDVPVVGDWDATGADRPGVVRGGQWFLSATLDAPVTRWAFSFGASGDRPAVGDWDGDGGDSVGVVRDTTFLGRDSLSGGAATVLVGFAG
jgi:N-acetylmuramoyl-L-alanine amidase